MDFNQLLGFAAVAELGHLTRAAEKLHLSQPALSARIKALESELGVALFERGASGMTLTAAGKQLLPAAAKVVASSDALLGKARAFRGEIAGRVRVGTLSDPDFIRLGAFLAQASEKFPLLEIELHHEISGAAFEKVRDGALDASFYYGDLVHPAVASVPLRAIAYCIAAPSAWQAQIAHATWEDIAALPWIMAPPISTHHALARQLFDARGSAPATVIEADHEAVIRSLVASGLGIALIREDLAVEPDAEGEICVWSEARLSTMLQFVHRRARRDDPDLRALLDLIADAWPETPAVLRPRADSGVAPGFPRPHSGEAAGGA